MKKKKHFHIQIGGRIQEARKLAGYTQERFAELVGVTPQYVSDVERGVTGVSLETLIRICEVLTISSDKILFVTEKYRDAVPVLERMKYIPEEYFNILEIIINKYLEAIAIKNRK